MQNNVDSLQFYLFWHWEYRRRNRKYRAYTRAMAYKMGLLGCSALYPPSLHPDKSLTNDPDIGDLFVWKSKPDPISKALMIRFVILFYEKFNMIPLSPNGGESSKKILADALDKTLNYEVPIEAASFFRYQIELTSMNPSRAKRSYAKEAEAGNIAKEEEIIFLRQKYFEEKDPDRRREIGTRWATAHRELLLAHTKSTLKRIKTDPIPRAVGLYLWDLWQEGKTKKDAVRAFLNEYEGRFPDGSAYNQEGTEFLEGKLDKTDECIRKSMVLPIS